MCWAELILCRGDGRCPWLGWQCWVSGLDPGQESIPASLWSLAGDAGSSNQIENTCGPYRWHIVAYRTVALISHASKVMLKIVQARLQQYMNCELPDVQTGFRKGRGTRDQIPTSAGSSKKQERSRKTSTSALLTMLKPLTVWITINCGKFWKRWEYQTTWPASWETCMQFGKQQLELDMDQQTGSK